MPSHRFAFWAPRRCPPWPWPLPKWHYVGCHRCRRCWACAWDTKPWAWPRRKFTTLGIWCLFGRKVGIWLDGMEYYIYMIEKYLTQPLSGIIYRPTYTYYHSHYHYHCHDQYHMMLISLSLSVSLSIYQNHDISHHFTLCRIISHHTKILYYTFTHINVYIYTHVIMFFLAISPYLCTTCPTGLPQGWRLSMWSCFFWQFPLFMHNLSHRAAAGLAPVQVGLGAVPWRHWGAPSSEKDGNLCQPTEGCSMDWFVQKCAETFSCIITLIYTYIYIYMWWQE